MPHMSSRDSAAIHIRLLPDHIVSYRTYCQRPPAARRRKRCRTNLATSTFRQDGDTGARPRCGHAYAAATSARCR